MFVNYFRDPTRKSRLNLAVGRAVLGFYVIWKTVWYDWELFLQTPFTLAGGAYMSLIPTQFPFLLTLEKWVLILVMLSFIVGYRLLLSSYLGAAILAHLAAVRFTLHPGGGTTSLFIGAWFIIFFGLYHEQTGLGVDTLRCELDSPPAVNGFLESESERVRMDAFRWSLLAFALVYFGAGFQKAVQGPLLEWATIENLGRTIIMMNARLDVAGGIGPYLVQYPTLMFLAAWGTIVLELGFILVVMLGISITPFVLGIFLMQLIIGLAMGPFFFDVYLLLMVFFAWDGLLKATSSNTELSVVYDEDCYFCARSLIPFKVLDVKDTIAFYSQRDVPSTYRNRDSVDFESAIYVFECDETYRGYFAFRKLLDHFGIFSPLVWLMGRKPVTVLGQRVYEFIAVRRSRIFTCSIEESDVTLEMETEGDSQP